MTKPSHIVVRGARTHNLRDVDVTVPRDSLVVFTGVSGSGKSSLVFDTIFSEGQRRFVQSLSPYARQFLGEVGRPEVDAVEGVSPALSIDQKTVNRNPRSTVGTVTEILDHLRLLWARLGQPHCPECDTPITKLSVESIVDRVLELAQGERVQVFGTLVFARKGEYRKDLETLAREGWLRVRIDGEMRRSDEPVELDRYVKHTIEVLVDRLRADLDHRARLSEAIDKARNFGAGLVQVEVGEQHYTFSTQYACPHHPDQVAPELEPRLFSFNAPQGQCPTCKGLGILEQFEPDRLFDPGQTLPGAFLGWNKQGHLSFALFGPDDLMDVVDALALPADKPWGNWSKAEQESLLFGHLAYSVTSITWDGYRVPVAWKGLIAFLDEVRRRSKFKGFDVWRSRTVCPDCGGARLNPIARSVRFRGRGLPALVGCCVAEAHAFFEGVRLDDDERAIGAIVLREINDRLGFLDEVGLSYLTLDRGAATLSGGESQRIRLASQVGSGLQGVTYVLDEPSIGLHARDNARLLRALKRLRDRGNSVLVVEHDEETIREADWVVDVGPGAGREGGHLVASGPLSAILQAESPTGRWLRGEAQIEVPSTRRKPDGRAVIVRGATGHNLDHIDVSLPLGLWTVVTGVSGSGKSSLVFDVLETNLSRILSGETELLGCEAIEGAEQIAQVVCVDQSPIGRNPRSNPATYTDAMTLIRELFAAVPESRARGWNKSRYSFNVRGGRCEDCQGAGVKVVEMQFLPDVEVVCETCLGKRYNAETLEIRYKGRNIHEVLSMTLGEAAVFFSAIPKLKRIFDTLVEIGLDYVTLGQPATTLSGGEAQRMKLASELRKPPSAHTLYLLDEPTTGLHNHDILKLVAAFQALVDAGHTVLVVEHHLDVIACADHVIDLGPEGGAEGGKVVGLGPPEQIAQCDTPTGRALAAHLRARAAQVPMAADRAPAYFATTPMVTRPDAIELTGVRTHNLANIDVRLPHGELVVVTGPSGSGKTSLVFDTVFSEGQRRYVESLSTYARRFLGRSERPPIEAAEGLQPSIAIDQVSSGNNPRSTVATVTEIHDVLRILYARAGIAHCPTCARTLAASSPSRVARELARLDPGAGSLVARLAPDEAPETRQAWLLQEGYQRLLNDVVGRESLPLDHPQALALLREGGLLVLDRFDPARVPASRISEAVTAAYRLGHAEASFVPRAQGDVITWTEGLCCPEHGVILAEMTPRHFSFNARIGMCEVCEGLGWLGSHAQPCPACGGDRFRPEIAAVTVGAHTLPQLSRLTVKAARRVVEAWSFEGERAEIAAPARQELDRRLAFLDDVGLGYLALDREAQTLSGGEARRIRLAGQLGSKLTGVTYVLDEPTIGLHARDTNRLLDTLQELRDLGNTVLVVEHDPETILRADHVLELGPAAGKYGGRIVAAGTPAQITADATSLTGRWLSGRETMPSRGEPRKPGAWMHIHNLYRHNLRIDALDLPLGVWSVVSGVSGAGKSTLLLDSLAPHLEALSHASKAASEDFTVELDLAIDEVVVVDQEAIGRTPRSTPSTYLDALGPIRACFASTAEARARGWDAGYFSFNRPGGRCETCEGRGSTLIEMHFLPDVWVTCPDCHGQRFHREALEVTYKGLTIGQVLHARVDEMVEVFAQHKKIRRALQALVDVGLGYLELGQSATTLSGGEAQRVKLAKALMGRKGHAVYLLDEPTTGLHLADVAKLVEVLQRLVDDGHTVIVVEHHLDLIAAADHVVELGPEGGEGGGLVIAQGTPAQVALRDTPTGEALRARFTP